MVHAVGGDPLSGTLHAATGLLSSMGRIDAKAEAEVIRAVVEARTDFSGAPYFRPSAGPADTVATSTLGTLQQAESTLSELVWEFRHAPDTKVALRLLASTQDKLRFMTAVRDPTGESTALRGPTLGGRQRHERAVAAGDWAGAFWTSALRLLTYKPDISAGVAGNSLQEFYLISTTVLASMSTETTASSNGAVRSTAVAFGGLVMTQGGSGMADSPPTLLVPALGPRNVPATARLTNDCADLFAKINGAWKDCPSNLWRTFTVLHPDRGRPVAGGPEIPGPYQDLSRATAELSDPCRQAAAAALPLNLTRNSLVVPADTALVDIEFRRGGLGVTTIVGVEDRPPLISYRHRNAPDLEDKIRRLLESVESGVVSDAPEFDPRLAHEVYRELFEGLRKVENYPRWIVSARMGALPLPIGMLVSVPTDCTGLRTNATGHGLSKECALIRFVADDHDIRYAIDLRDALSWFTQVPALPVEAMISVVDPVFFNDPDDPRCRADGCRNLPGLHLRNMALKSAGRRFMGRAVGLSASTVASCQSADALRALAGGEADAGKLTRLAESMKWKAATHTGLAANEDNCRAALEAQRPTLVHVSSHLLTPGFTGKAGENLEALACPFGLVLAAKGSEGSSNHDGFLSVEELRSEPNDFSNVSLLLLSGCKGGAPVLDAVPPAVSLGTELRVKGVRSVLTPLWPVEVLRSSQGVEVVLEAARTGRTLHETLARSRQQWRHRHPHPAHWAGLVLLGPGHPISLVPAGEEGEGHKVRQPRGDSAVESQPAPPAPDERTVPLMEKLNVDAVNHPDSILPTAFALAGVGLVVLLLCLLLRRRR